MRSSVFSSGGIKLDTETADQGKKQVVTAESQTVPKKGSSEPPVRVRGVLSTIHNLHSKAKTFSSSQSAVTRPGQSPIVIKGQEENWVNLGPLTLPLAKQMGAEGTPVKSKSLFGQASHNHMGKMDPVASNGSKQPRKAGPMGGIPLVGVPSPEHGTDGKRRNLLKAVGHATTQTGCIRQILLLQLELIEQQQQQLQSKNKEIDNLKAEKDMLMARIERMEHRIQMESRPRQTPRRREAMERVSSEKTGCSEGQSHMSRQMPLGRSGKSLKRRFLFQESRMARSRYPQPKTPPLKESQAFKEEVSEDEGEGDEKEEEEENETTASPEIQTYDSPLVRSEELPYLATTEMYLCCWHQPPPSPWRDPSPEQDDIVPVPSWREIVVDPLEYETAKDIAENVDDGVFLKRHTKLELDEKRRKRWDIQRIREQRIYQRLQQRTNRNKVVQEPDPELLSFYPEAEEVESIVITPFLPVVAFGRPLPHIQQQNFDLPWLDERNCYRQDVSKKKPPHRTCRK